MSKLLKEKPFSFRERSDGTVAVYWKRQLATTLTGKLAENLLAAAPESSEDELQLLLARASGNFRGGNERKQRR